MKYRYPSIAKFQQPVELKDYRPATKMEYIDGAQGVAV